MAVTAPPTIVTTSGPDGSTARITGLCYLALAVAGGVGFMIIRPQLFDPAEAAATLANLRGHEALARAGIAGELIALMAQVLAALWFYRLFRPVHAFAAAAIGVFGTMNGVVLLGSAAALATALGATNGPAPAATSQLMYLLSENLWGAGNLFFGLWLIPMGYVVLQSGWAPRILGWILIAGGIGYLANAFAAYLVPSYPAALGIVLAIPATIGEFWMIGWLLTRRGGRVVSPGQ